MSGAGVIMVLLCGVMVLGRTHAAVLGGSLLPGDITLTGYQSLPYISDVKLLMEYLDLDPCTFQCPTGTTLQGPDPNYTPTSNGCGPSNIGNSYYTFENITHLCENFSHCCDMHDLCYGTCGGSKDVCDNALLSCMTASSTDTYPLNYCKVGSVMLYLVVVYGGCEPWRTSQAAACLCQ